MSQALPPALNDSALRKQAADQVASEIAAQVDPLQAQIGTAQRRQEGALQQFGQVYDAIQPQVQQSAEAVGASYDQAQLAQNAIFTEANARLNDLRGQRAAEAQKMAQQIGGPVAIADYTKPYDDASQQFTYLSAGQQLHTLGYAQAGVQQAQRFAGTVFPLLRTEQDANIRRQYDTEIRELQDQITAVQKQKGALTNARFSQLRGQELQYRLEVAQQKLEALNNQRNYNLQVKQAKTQAKQADKTYKLSKQQLDVERTKAERDWAATKSQLALEGRKVDLAEQTFEIQQGELTGKYGGKPTLQAKTQAAADRRDAVALGIDLQELQIRRRAAELATKSAQAKLKEARKSDWVELMDSALNPAPGKTIVRTYAVPVPKASVELGRVNDAYVDASSPTGYSRNEDVKEPTKVSEPINDPTRLVDYLLINADELTREQAVELVRARLNLPKKWKYGMTWPPKTKAKSKTGDPYGLGRASTYGGYSSPGPN